MRRVMTGFVVAIGFAALVQAQETKTTTRTEVSGKPETVTFSGCVQTGTEARSYILDKAVPIGESTKTEVGTSGTVTRTTTTTYALVPGERVDFQTHVGHKVEVTGMMMPGGKIESETKIEREGAPDTKIEEKTKNAPPQFRVMSIKELSESCS